MACFKNTDPRHNHKDDFWRRHKQPRVHIVNIPEEDRFAPFALTIRKGDVVKWTNNNGDAHTVVSDDAVNSTGPFNVNQIIEPGQSFQIKFRKAGQWVYFCRFHAHLDEFNQPIAPGCGEEGDEIEGIVTPEFRCGNAVIRNNFGTPMMGVITILNKKKRHNSDSD